jgi:integrase
VTYQRQDLKGRSRWIAQWTDPATGRLRQKSVRAKDKREADRLEFELQRHAHRQREGLEPLTSDGGSTTVGRLLERWLTAKQYAPSAARDASTVRKHLLGSALAGTMVSQLKASDLENFLDEKLAAGLAPQTVNHLRGYVSRAFTTARRKGWWTGVNPVTDVQRKPVPKGVVGDYLRVEEVPVVLEQLARRWRPLFAAALYTGLRKGELRALRKEDVDLDRALILVRRSGARATTKGGHANAIPIHPELVPFLRHAIDSSPSPLVFPGSDGDMFSEDTDLAAVLRRAMARAGLVTHWTHVCRRHRCAHREDAPDNGQRRCPEHHCLLWPKPHVRPIRFHDLRHSAASLLFMAGADAVAVQKVLRSARFDFPEHPGPERRHVEPESTEDAHMRHGILGHLRVEPALRNAQEAGGLLYSRELGVGFRSVDELRGRWQSVPAHPAPRFLSPSWLESSMRPPALPNGPA